MRQFGVGRAFHLRVDSYLPGKRLLERLIPPLDDPPNGWRGVGEGERGDLSVVRYGDCSWRQIEHGAHQLGREPGYPRAVAERLRDRGAGMVFQNHHCTPAEALPQDEADLRRHLAEGVEPDVVWVQVGCAYGIRSLLPFEKYSNRVRLRVNARMGAFGGALHTHLVRPCLRVAGRRCWHYPGGDAVASRLESFFALVRGVFPDAGLLFLAPWDAGADGWMDPKRLDAVVPVLAKACARSGVPVLDVRGQLRAAAGAGARVHGPNGYDLTRAGHELVADALLRATLDVAAAGSAVAAAHG